VIDPRTTSLLPAGEVVGEDEELAAVDAAEERELLAPPAVVDAPPPLGRGWLMDFQRGRFVPAATGGPAATYGTTTLRLWIEKCIRTRRGAHPALNEDYGIDLDDDLWGGGLDDEAIVMIEDGVRDALLIHPRIAQVRDFSAEVWDDDAEGALNVHFTVVLDDDSAYELRDLRLVT
jgi:hypothetical protein